MALGVVVGALVVAGIVAAAVSTTTGPRVSRVAVDPAAAATSSGARLILTASERVAPVDEAQVDVSPATPFTVDTSGRSIGIRFAMPLDDATTYTVTIRDVTGAGGGPTSTLSTDFDTPPAEVFLLQRGETADTIFRTELAGTAAHPVYSAPHIEDYRATASHLVVVERDDAGHSRLVATDLAGGDVRDLPLPGDGYVANLQSADRGELVGYTFSSADLDDDAADGLLYTTSLRDTGAPMQISVAGRDARVLDWRFVPDTDRVLMLTFDGTLLVAGGSGPETLLGTAMSIEGIAPGTLTAIVERIDGPETIDLASGVSAPLVPAADQEGIVSEVTPVAGGGTLRTFGLIADGAVSLGTDVVLVADDGASTPVFHAASEDAVVQTCVSPNGRYAGILLAPDAVTNPYDGYRLPLPSRLETHIVDLRTQTPVVALAGFDISWCRVPPQ